MKRLLYLLVLVGVNLVYAQSPFTLVIFHNNDGESHLLAEEVTLENKKALVASVGQFKTTLDSMKQLMQDQGYHSITVSSGDNFLAGLEYNASINNNTSYDAIALDSIKYDAIDLGNHDFDFGTQALANLIEAFEVNKAPYLSANLSFENVPELQKLVKEKRIKPYTVVERAGQKIGIIGLTTPILPSISSIGKTIVSEAIVDSTMKYVRMLQQQNINKIILISHLQGLATDLEFISQIDGVDVVIAGGGDELLCNNPELGKPFKIEPYGEYPIFSKDKSSRKIPIVTTPGGYRFLGQLIVDFNKNGEVIKVHESDPILVQGKSNAGLVKNVEEPILKYIGNLSTKVIATSDVDLDFKRESIRVRESNGGNLMADAILYQAQKDYEKYGVAKPNVAIQNAGGLRIESEVSAGKFTEDLTYKIATFNNVVSVVENIPATKFLEIIEFGLAKTPIADGRFPQIAGFKITFDPTKPSGKRVKTIELNNGTMLVQNGKVVENAPLVTLATISFTAGGGDGYPFAPYTYTTLGATYQQALYNYILNDDALGSIISEMQYPFDMNDRIIVE